MISPIHYLAETGKVETEAEPGKKGGNRQGASSVHQLSGCHKTVDPGYRSRTYIQKSIQ